MGLGRTTRFAPLPRGARRVSVMRAGAGGIKALAPSADLLAAFQARKRELVRAGAASDAAHSAAHRALSYRERYLDEITEAYEKWPAERDYETAAGLVAEGTQAGLRFEIRGIKDGREVVVVEHVTRMHDETAPNWPQPTGEGCYRVLIEGQPRMRCNFELLGADGDHNEGGLVATAMRLLNAIPAVCDAPPGMLSILDLPLITGRHLVS